MIQLSHKKYLNRTRFRQSTKHLNIKKRFQSILSELLPMSFRRDDEILYSIDYMRPNNQLNESFNSGESLSNSTRPIASSIIVDQSNESIDSLTYTDITIQKFSHLWVIDNFHTYIDDPVESVCLTSTTFSPPNISSTREKNPNKFRLLFYPKETPMSLKLNYIQGAGALKVRAKFFIISDSYENNQIEISNNARFHIYNGPSYSNYMATSNPVTLREDVINNALITNDRLRILLKMEIMGSPKSESIATASMHSLDTTNSNVSSDLKRLFDSGEFADTKVIVKWRENNLSSNCSELLNPFEYEDTFNVHKTILAARSPVFKVMLTSSYTTENQSGQVKIEEFSPHTINYFLEFLYAGQLSKCDCDYIELFRVADKYEVSDLRLLCEQKLVALIKSENAAEILLLADLCRSSVLKNEAIEFVARHVDEVVASEGWSKYVVCEHELVTQVLKFTGSLIN
ncbi:hypothetical protein ACOME3_001399 [Neoechinorhynchus agilis]